MPSVSVLKRARWKEEFREASRMAYEGMVEPYTLESLYPAKEVEQEDGTLLEVRSMMAHQRRFHEMTSLSGKQADYYLHSGGYGSGKSICACVHYLWLARKYPGIKLVWILPYDYYIDEFVLPTLRLVLEFEDDDASLVDRFNSRDKTINFKNKTLWRFKAYDEATKVKGWNANCIHVEEASELGGSDNYKGLAIFRALIGRWRGQGRYPRIFSFTQNPNGHNWLWKLFVKDSPQARNPKITWIVRPEDDYIEMADGAKRKRGMGVCYKEYEYIDASGNVWATLTSGSNINTHNPKGYLEAMLSSVSDDPDSKQRFIDGDFNPINTLCYGMPYYSHDTHIVPWQEVLEYWGLEDADEGDFFYSRISHWPLWVGIDTGGQSSPWAVEFYVEMPEDSGMLGIGEIYTVGDTWPEIAAKILRWVEHWDGPIRYFIDPISSRQHSGPNQECIFDEFTHYGIPVETPAGYATNQKACMMHIRSLLKPDRSQGHMFLSDDPDPNGMYRIGRPHIYYIKDEYFVDTYDPEIPGSRNNPEGRAMLANSLEKDVYRMDNRKARAQGAHEEGLSRPGPEKIIPIDDHAQTAEMFALVGKYPPARYTRNGPKPITGKAPYPGSRKRGR